MKIYNTREILGELEEAIVQKEPFSLIRFGDGGIKLLHSLYYNDDPQLVDIIYREGLPDNKILEFVELWGRYARQANFIDTPEVYFTRKFWNKCKRGDKKVSGKTIDRMEMWKDLYSRAEFDNERYCNPEVNYLMCLKSVENNLLSIMENRSICCISTLDTIPEPLAHYNMEFVTIVGHYENQYQHSFIKTIDIIKQYAQKYDLWLIAAGELGRIYTGLIKQLGGRALDIGFVIDYWVDSSLVPDRLLNFIKSNEENPLEFELTPEGKQYERFL